MNNKYIDNRVIKEACYMIDNNSTVRCIAKVFGVSKSTVHKDLRQRLITLDKNLYDKVDYIFKNHIDTRHLKGGYSTKMKYCKGGLR